MGNYDFSLDLESVNTMSVINGWIRENSRVLEFGPANGRLTGYLKTEKHCSMTIVEIDAETGKEAAQYAEKAYLGEEGNIEKFLWTKEKEPFDYILFADVLEHLHCPDRVLKEAANLLTPDGEILVSVPNITHNSILIDLINDKFDYAETGLLDRTHVHFFSYDSFIKMCGECDMKAVDMVPIYSRVGDNEIHNTWREVPAELERILRRKKHGSVYQYVYRIRKKQSNMPACTKLPEGLIAEEKAAFEAQLYYRSRQEGYSEEKCIRSIYHDGDEAEVILNLADAGEVSEVRFDPMADPGLIELLSVQIVGTDGVRDLHSTVNNASVTWRRWYLFRETDPQMMFTIPQEISNGQLVIRFRLLEYRISGDKADWIGSFFAERDLEIEQLRKENAEASAFAQRLENEILLLKRKKGLMWKIRDGEV